MVEHAFITSMWPEGRDSARGFALGLVTALGPHGRDERIRLCMCIGPATRCDTNGPFPASKSIADHRRLSQLSSSKSQQCGQSATHDGLFPYSLAMFSAAMVIRNI